METTEPTVRTTNNPTWNSKPARVHVWTTRFRSPDDDHANHAGSRSVPRARSPGPARAHHGAGPGELAALGPAPRASGQRRLSHLVLRRRQRRADPDGGQAAEQALVPGRAVVG